ncbi:MAG: hypothetical protein QXF82_07955 [Nitrososphaeria archaeon]
MHSMTNYSLMQGILSNTDCFETRIENDSNGNPIYVGISTIPNASVDDQVWKIMRLYYTGTALERVQIADSGAFFIYSWSDRATYFS